VVEYRRAFEPEEAGVPKFNATPLIVGGLVGGVAAVVGWWLWRRNGSVASGPVPVEVALADLLATGHLIIVTALNPVTGLFEAFVPGLPGNTLLEIQPNSTLFITMSVTHVVVSSGVSFVVLANTPTQVQVGATVSISVQS
jgi:hypothetical protein